MLLERPIFWLGLAGLSPPERALLTAYLPPDPGSLPAWRVAKFSEADAWCISGTAAELTEEGILTVPDSRRAEPDIAIDFRKLDRPLAFTKPVRWDELAPLDQFDPASERAVQMVLKKFETSLRSLRAQFSLGAFIRRSMPDLRPLSYHVVHRTTLLAVVDLGLQHVHFLPDVSPLQLEGAVWLARQPSDGGAGPAAAHFAQASLSEIMWHFAQRSAADVLPEQFTTGAIRLRHSPRVPQSLLKESQAKLLRILAGKATSLNDLLAQNPNFNRGQLGRDLAALYFDGAIAASHVDV
ncbi:MAG: hypothetical protein JWQ88_1153, partial [Rhodoferax sp.]|nr:hypothetical protein [Rhodoferax sp.]